MHVYFDVPRLEFKPAKKNALVFTDKEKEVLDNIMLAAEVSISTRDERDASDKKALRLIRDYLSA